MKVCGEPGCTELTDRPYCAHHARPWADSPRRHELPPNWAALRKAVLRRDNRTCTVPHCTATATEVDHINGHSNELDNLRSLCWPHHQAHTTTQAAATRAELAALNRGETPC